jgi:adenylate cyclase
MSQGYLVGVSALRAGFARASVRVRIAGDKAWFNVKAAQRGIARAEYEVPLPPDDAQQMLDTLCDGVLEKIRHYVTIDNTLFEIDEFLGANLGLIVAEVELPTIDAAFPQPFWLGAEVSALDRYFNVNLIEHPYAKWSDAERMARDGEQR